VEFPQRDDHAQGLAGARRGCTIVLKPAEQTPFSALALAELAVRAGFPKGVLNIITGDAPAIGRELCTNPVVRKITFTGFTEVGRILMRQSADQVKKLGLELGGNAPFIVFDDADLDAGGHGRHRLEVPQQRPDVRLRQPHLRAGQGLRRVRRKLAEKVKALKVAKGTEPGRGAGPAHRRRGGREGRGARGRRPGQGRQGDPGRASARPGRALLRAHHPHRRHQGDEGLERGDLRSVAPLYRFKDEADVIAQANDTEFGLASYFYARDIARVWRVAEALETGIVGVNTGLISTEVAPFGGVKQSGLGAKDRSTASTISWRSNT
jgi:succinate-semialdehyde dehydrogenase/glutarate-semialdehyde dehydrogenase